MHFVTKTRKNARRESSEDTKHNEKRTYVFFQRDRGADGETGNNYARQNQIKGTTKGYHDQANSVVVW